ncbi:MAG: rRNA maturation RNase YbeY [Candidatus Omnitrophota bacterium]
MKVAIRDLQDKVKIDKRRATKLTEAVLKKMGEGLTEVSLMFVDDLYIRRLNQKYLGIDSSTDVLAFSMREGEGLSDASPILGDVVISTETAKREAIKRKKNVQDETDLYLVHGLLHLLGYDDRTKKDKKKMRLKEKELMEER